MRQASLVGVVGPCASGKSTLVERLKASHVAAKNIAQEHSYVPEMWQILTKPGLLIYLDVSYQIATHRRNLDWTEAEYETQLKRLEHARQHADLIVHTDELNREQVLDVVLKFVAKSHSGRFPQHFTGI